MLILGILAIVQIIFVPGYILISHLKLRNLSTIQKLLYIFSFSLFINYTLVTVLTLLGLYKLVLILIIISLEVLYIAYLIIAKKQILLFDLEIREYLLKYFSFFERITLSKKILLFITTTIILFYFSLIISNLGTIFYFVDPVYNIHWNTWAIDFANNILPKQSLHFPQLIPANWSLSYLIIDQPNVHFFPKSIMPLFFFGNLLIFLDLTLSKRNFIYLVGMIIYGLFAPIIYSLVFIADGNGDLPVSFFAFLTFYAFQKIDKEKFVLIDHLLFFLFASMAASTKLAGFYTFTIAATYSLFILFKYWKSINVSEKLIIFLSVILIVSISHFWYLLKPAVMYSGLHQPEWVGENYQLIFIRALKLIYYNWGLPVVTFLFLTLLSSLFVKKSRYVTLIMVIPPLIIWMFKFSSDFRNLSFVVPFISYSSAFGLIKLIEISLNKRVNLNYAKELKENLVLSSKKIILGGIISALCVIGFLIINTDYFYDIIYRIYKFISMYYFHSYRISLLIDYTPFINIDYYQNVIGVMLLLIPALFIIVLLKIKVRHILSLLLIASIALNFTLIKKEDLLLHQEKDFEIVDARNYGFTLNTIVNNTGVDKTIYTNFKTIVKENKTEKLNFIYKAENEVTELLITGISSSPVFLKMDLLNSNIVEMIDAVKSNEKTDILFDDGRYIFFTYN